MRKPFLLSLAALTLFAAPAHAAVIQQFKVADWQVGAYTNDSLAFAKRMLDETGVAATPGIDFDAGRGSRFLRFSYAGLTEDMSEAAARRQRWDASQR